MKFYLIDKVESITPDKLVGVKYVSLAEEYLADHFPTFPVLPGVMMLEALTQACTWVLHLRHDFASSIIVLKEAKNVKYGSFVAPGNFLRLSVELVREDAGVALFKVAGLVNDVQAVTGRLELACFNLASQQPHLADIDARLIEHHRQRWALIVPATVEFTQQRIGHGPVER